MVVFGDAAVAIAITLLVLPLTEAVPEALHDDTSALEFITGLQGEIYTFLLSFVVIAQLWAAHHRLFEHVVSYSPALLRWHFAWLLTIVVLPFPTAMTAGFGDDLLPPLLYIGTVLASSLCLTALNVVVRRDARLHDGDLAARQLFHAVTITSVLVVAFGLACIPGVGYLALLLLLLPPVIVRFRFGPTH
jgi:uncharacterized membrane protein